MKKLLAFVLTSGTLLLLACGGGEHKPIPGTSPTEETKSSATIPSDEKRGIGKFTKVDIPATLDAKMATDGESIAQTKCLSCHKLSEEKLVGPGWKGVTKRRSAEWIMNFVTNTEEMLNKDPAAMANLEICLVRMPNQNLSDEDARKVYEFIRKNDGVK